MKNKKVVIFSVFIFFSAVLSAFADEKTHTGSVTFTVNTDKYTYIKLDESGKEVWLAALTMQVSVGDVVEYTGGVLMKDFHSKAMEKTFEYILFVTRIRVLKSALSEKKEQMPGKEYHENIPGMEQAVPLPKKGKIVKAEGSLTIKEIFSDRDQLTGSEITLRAKVMKVSKNILGKDWVTLQDGTGVSPEDRLIATTTEAVNTGDVLTVKGTVITDVNIGTGYSYKVMIENAVFSEPR